MGEYIGSLENKVPLKIEKRQSKRRVSRGNMETMARMRKMKQNEKSNGLHTRLYKIGE